MQKTYLTTILITVLLTVAPTAWADTPAPSTDPATTVLAQAEGDTSQTSLDWGGVYRGILRSDKKAGIVTTLTLNTSHTYTISRIVSGQEGKGTTVKGTFSWLAGGGSVLLSGVGGLPARFIVGENQLWQLDENGKALKDSALLKIAEATAPALEGTKWLLVEIAGSDAPLHNELERPNFIIDGESGKVTGFAGCNRFFGDYIVKANDSFEFRKLAVTKMACPQMEVEQQFLAALERVNSCRLLGATLYLNDGDECLLELRVADDNGENDADQ